MKKFKSLVLDRTGFLICLGIIVFASIIFFPLQANAAVNSFNFVTSNISYQSTIGSNGANVGYTVTATNNGSPVSTIICNPLSGTIFPVGKTPVICSAMDSLGNTESTSFIISVNGADSTPPTIISPSDITATPSGTLTNVALGTPQVIDNADLSPLVTNNQPVGGFPTGVTNVIWTATDHSGNSATATQKVTITSFASLTVTATPPGSAVPYKTVQAVTLSSSDPSNIYYTIDGSIPTKSSAIYKNPISVSSNMTIKFMGTFSNGTAGPVNTASYTIDTIVPVITRTGASPVTIQQGSGYSDLGATANDNRDGNISPSIITGGLPINTSILGTYTVTYNVSDQAGNAAAQVTRTVKVVGAGTTTTVMSDTTASAGMSTWSGRQIHAEFVSASSALVGKNIDTIQVKLKRTGTPTGLVSIGVFNTDLSAKQIFGTVDASTVTAGSYTDYTVSLPVSQTYSIQSGDRIGVKYTGGDSTTSWISVMTDKNNVFDGTNSYRTYYTTAWNLVQTEDLYMTLKVANGSTSGDTTPPVITLLGANQVTIQRGSSYVDAGATANDNIDGNITPSIITSNPVNTSILGTYTITYNVSDQAGNAATQVTRTVKVVDTISPTVSASPPANLYNSIQSVILTASEPATIYYTMDGSTPTTSSQVYNSPVSINSNKTFKFFAKDIAGNAGSVATVSYAIDTISPVITLLGSSQVSTGIGSSYVDAGATANDNRDGNITPSIVTSGLPINTAIAGTYTVTYNVSDQAGNAATPVTRTVVVGDTTPPVITLRGSNPITVLHGSTYTDPGATALDNIDGNITSSIITSNPVDTSVLSGTFTVTYDVQDQAGNNAAQVTRTVNVVPGADTTPPTLSIVSPANNTSTTTPTVQVSGTASDDTLVQSVTWKVDSGLVSTATGTANWSFTTASLSVGPHTIWVNATDSSGNVAKKHLGITITTGSTGSIMNDTVASGGQPIYSGKPVQAEYASATSVLVGKNMNSILVNLKKVGTPTGTAQIGVFNTDLSVKKLFGTIDVSTISTSSTQYTFTLTSSQTYLIQSGDRIGIQFTGGDSTNRVSVMTDKTNAFDGANSYRTTYTTAWGNTLTEDLYMILK